MGDFSYRTHADFYPEYCDLDVDPNTIAGTTRQRFIAILSSREPRDQARILRGIIERFPPDQGPSTRSAAHAHVLELIQRLDAEPGVASVTPHVTTDVVLRALSDAESLIGSSGATRAVDRIHTALHGHLQAVCDSANIPYERDTSMGALLRKLRESHPQLQDLGPRSQDVERVLNACGTILDALLPIRNQASAAHPNRTLLDEPEARLVINASKTILTYLDDRLS